MSTGPSEPLLTIGEFARLTRLTAKALRIYDEFGLLRPQRVDRSTGYRFYSAEQAHTLRLIGLLRATNLGLAEVALLLAELDTDPAAALDRLDRHLRRLEAEHTSCRISAAARPTTSPPKRGPRSSATWMADRPPDRSR